MQRVRQERERDARRLQDAQDAVSAAQGKLDSLNSQISAQYSMISRRKAEIAKLTLQGIEAAAVVTPVDLDPRVASLVVAKETAIAALEVIKAPFKGIPIIDGDYSGDIEATLDISGLHGSVTANFDGYSALKGNVTFGLQPEACISIPTLGNACTRL